MNMKHEWMGVPVILMKKLIMNAGIILGVLATGVFMEIHQEGEGVLKLTILCVAGLGLYFLYLCQVIFQKKYETLVGKVTLIQNCKSRRKYWEIEVVDGECRAKQLLVPVQSGVRKGIVYRFFLKNAILLGVEEKCDEPCKK